MSAPKLRLVIEDGGSSLDHRHVLTLQPQDDNLRAVLVFAERIFREDARIVSGTPEESDIGGDLEAAARSINKVLWYYTQPS